ncbi:MAG TPA: glutaminase [Nitrospirales bacterium]|nr:glutaminase [Nitrospiraceae bacterium]HNP27936.1 glutaminase [Nitrospirales bacterium]
MDYQGILEEIHHEVLQVLPSGTVATYIPQLASVSPQKFGMAVQTIDGKVFQVGHASEPFSIQSISKVFTLTLGFTFEGDKIWTRVGLEPSGSTFNSLVQLEYEHGIPRNPFINAGALVISDILVSRLKDSKPSFLDYVRQRANNDSIQDDPQVARSERQSGFRNAAMANFLKSFSNLTNEVEEVLEFYCFHCSLSMSCVDLAKGFLFLANKGHCPWTNQQILTQSQTKRVNALMLTCGTYDAAGDFAFNVGLPGKSGVGGGIVGVLPNRLTVAVWSPGLNEKGNSFAGQYALELFTTKTGVSIF